MSGTCTVVMYHYVRDVGATRFREIRALSPDAFEQQLDWLAREHTIVEVGDLEAALDGRRSLPADAALLTFDDGFVDHHRVVLPILRARGLTGVFFLAEDASGPAPRMLSVHKTHFLLARLGAEAFGRAVLAAVDRPLDGAPASNVLGVERWEEAHDRAIKQLINYQLPFDEASRVLDALFAEHIGDSGAFARELYLDEAMAREMAAAGMTIGYHTRRHRMLSRLDRAEQAAELERGVGWIAGLTGQRSVPFCYPWGGLQTYDRETVGLLRELGYSLAFNTVRRRCALGVDGRYELPRFDTRDLPPHAEAVGVAAGERDEA